MRQAASWAGPAPAVGCRQTAEGASALHIKDGSNDASDQFKWKWRTCSIRRDPTPRWRGSAAPSGLSERKQLAAARAEERARKRAEAVRQAGGRRLERALRDANAAVRAREHALSLLEQEQQAAERALEDARAVVRDLERQLAVLGGDVD